MQCCLCVHACSYAHAHCADPGCHSSLLQGGTAILQGASCTHKRQPGFCHACMEASCRTCLAVALAGAAVGGQHMHLAPFWVCLDRSRRIWWSPVPGLRTSTRERAGTAPCPLAGSLSCLRVVHESASKCMLACAAHGLGAAEHQVGWITTASVTGVDLVRSFSRVCLDRVADCRVVVLLCESVQL